MWIFIAGGLGCTVRWGVVTLLHAHAPWGVWLCNMMGCIGAGMCHYALTHDSISITLAKPLLVGFLGGLTTFSSLMLDAMGLWTHKAPLYSLGYVGCSLLVGAMMLGAGYAIASYTLTNT